jgi:hypothetical protein
VLGFTADTGGLIRSILPTAGAVPGFGMMGLGHHRLVVRGRCGQGRELGATADADIFLSRIHSGASTTPCRACIFLLPVVYGENMSDTVNKQNNRQLDQNQLWRIIISMYPTHKNHCIIIFCNIIKGVASL